MTAIIKNVGTGALMICALAAGACSEAPTATAQTQPAAVPTRPASGDEELERTNKEVVTRAYAAWAAGGTNFFDILADDATWTILGQRRSAVTYRSKADFLARAITPFSSRVSAPLIPTVRSIYADGDQVVALFDAQATLANGQPYRNTYAWFFRMRDGKAVEVRALLDLAAYDAVIANVRPNPAR